MGKSLNQSLKLGTNEVLFFVFRGMGKLHTRNTFILMKISISFKAILSSVHKPARFRKQPANLECLLYSFSCGMVGLVLCKVSSSLGYFTP